MQVEKSFFLEQCAALNNQIVENISCLGVAVRCKDTQENFLHKISDAEKTAESIKYCVQTNLKHLDIFLDFLLYFFEKTEEMLQILRPSATKSAADILDFLQTQTLTLLIVLQNRSFGHEKLYMELQQSELLLGILLDKIRSLMQAATGSVIAIKIELQDTLHDLVLSHKYFAHHLRRLTHLEEKILKFQ